MTTASHRLSISLFTGLQTSLAPTARTHPQGFTTALPPAVALRAAGSMAIVA
jgi:hypothetical protein